jgi:hypothetical protein
MFLIVHNRCCTDLLNIYQESNKTFLCRQSRPEAFSFSDRFLMGNCFWRPLTSSVSRGHLQSADVIVMLRPKYIAMARDLAAHPLRQRSKRIMTRLALPEAKQFVAAARADAPAALRIQAMRPDLPASLAPIQLRLLPDSVAWGNHAASVLMVALH